MKIFLMSLTILFIFSHKINGQELNKEHSVKKGETVYRISKIYNVSVSDIFALNPNSREVIYPNDILLIPNNNSNEQLNSEKPISSVNNLKDGIYIVKKGDTKYGISRKFGITISQLEENNPHIINGLQAEHTLNLNISQINNAIQTYTPNEYLVKKGDTKYGLSKKFGVTISHLEQNNPHIINGLQATQILRVHSSKNEEVVQDLNPQTYLVKKGDTKYGLSKIFNTSIAQLESANPEIVNILNYGITINIPQSKKDNETKNGATIVEDSNEIVTNEITKSTDDSSKNIPSESNTKNYNDDSGEFTNLRLTINTAGTLKLLLVLPFSESEFEALNTNTKNIDDSFILKNVEFLRGAKMAIDSVINLGVKIEMDILKIIPNNSADSKLSLNQNENNLNSYDGIISPFYENETGLISESLKDKDIPIVTLNALSPNNKSGNIYMVMPQEKFKKLKLINYLNDKQGNIILISDPSREINKRLVLAQSPNANIVDVREQGENLNSELILALDKQKTNYVIIDSQKNNVFLNSTNILLKQSSEYPIQLAVLETSLIPASKSLSAKRFKVLNLIYPALKKKKIDDTSMAKTPDNISLGYDITFDTLLRMSQPISFETSVKQAKTSYSTLNINYQKGSSDFYFNNEVSILEFNNMELLKSKND